MDDFSRTWERSQRSFTQSLRPLQKREFQCCANCADDANATEEQFEQCLKKCGQTVARIGELYAREATVFQNQVEVCLQECRTAAETRIPPDAREIPPQVEADLKLCANKCQAQFIVKIPEFFSRLNAVVKQYS
jgi:hypothetical protein